MKIAPAPVAKAPNDKVTQSQVNDELSIFSVGSSSMKGVVIESMVLVAVVVVVVDIVVDIVVDVAIGVSVTVS